MRIRDVRKPKQPSKRYWLIFWAVAACCLYILFRVVAHEQRLNLVPAELKVQRVSYVSEENWGFGPGGNETSIVIYELSNEVAAEIKKQGITFFSNAEILSKRLGYQRSFEVWAETPLNEDRAWSSGDALIAGRTTIIEYLGKYGFLVPLSPSIEKLVDSVITTKGSYYSYGRLGIVIVAPDQRKVVFAHAG